MGARSYVVSGLISPGPRRERLHASRVGSPPPVHNEHSREEHRATTTAARTDEAGDPPGGSHRGHPTSPEGWDWQWVVQEDGETDAVRPYIPDDPRVTFGQGRPGRAGVARTLALSRARGEYLKVLDADDMLTPGALARDLRALTDNPIVSWATSRVLDLLPDGSTVGFDQDPPEGVIERGAVLAHWKAHAFRAQVHPATPFARRDLVLALGGWMALPASEDTGLLLALERSAAGGSPQKPACSTASGLARPRMSPRASARPACQSSKPGREPSMPLNAGASGSASRGSVRKRRPALAVSY
jgi:hypothetical protein